MNMTEIKPINSIYNDRVCFDTEPYSYDMWLFPNHEMQHWNIDIQYNQKDNNHIEGKLIFSNTDNPDETIEFIFNEQSQHYFENSGRFDLHILKTDENQPDIEIKLDISKDKNGNCIIYNLDIITDMHKITNDTNFIDYDNLVANTVYLDNYFIYNQDIQIDLNKSTNAHFRTDYFDNWNPWNQ
jgi:hypothetical protein